MPTSTTKIKSGISAGDPAKTFTDNQITILKCEKKQLAGPQPGSFTARLGGLGPEKIVRHVQRTTARGKAKYHRLLF